MPTNIPTASLPAPAPTSLDELEDLLYAEAVRHYLAAQRLEIDELQFVRGHTIGCRVGYAQGIAAAIHFITGEPVPDIAGRVVQIAQDEAEEAS